MSYEDLWEGGGYIVGGGGDVQKDNYQQRDFIFGKNYKSIKYNIKGKKRGKGVGFGLRIYDLIYRDVKIFERGEEGVYFGQLRERTQRIVYL